MLDSLQVLRAELSELRQQQSHQHSSRKYSLRRHKKSSRKKKSKRLEGLGEPGLCRQLEDFSRVEASTESPPPSSTVIPTSLPSILPPFPPSSLISTPTFVDSIIISITPSTSQIHDPNPVFDFVYSITCSIPALTPISTEQLSQLSTCIDHTIVMINKLVSHFLTFFFLKQTFQQIYPSAIRVL